jgi:hypothetical protein
LPNDQSHSEWSGEELVTIYGIENGTKLSNCSICHR